MSDIEAKSEAVIKAARNLIVAGDDSINTSHCFRQLHAAIYALDAAKKPDPWQLLEYAYENIPSQYDSRPEQHECSKTIAAALKWRKQNHNT